MRRTLTIGLICSLLLLFGVPGLVGRSIYERQDPKSEPIIRHPPDRTSEGTALHVASSDPTVFFDGFEDGNANGWNLDPHWRVTTVRSSEGTYSIGCPGNGGSYGNNWDQNALSPPISIPDTSKVMLEFDIWWDIETGWDDGYVYIKELGGSWNQLDHFDGNIRTWQHKSFNISSYTDTDVKIRFRLDTDYSIRYEGIYVDNIRVKTKEEIKILTPLKGRRVSDTTLIQISTTVSEENVTDVEVRINDESWIEITEKYNPKNGLWEYNWDTTAYTDGMHSLVTRVNTTTSSSTSATSYVLSDNHPSTILLLDDDGATTYEKNYTQTLESLGYTLGYGYDSWNISVGGTPRASLLTNYQRVIWLTGTVLNPLNQEERTILQNYLDHGGFLFISSQNLGSQLNETPFYKQYLKANCLNFDTGLSTVNGSDFIYPNVSYTLIGIESANNANSPSSIDPRGNAREEMTYETSGEGVALSFEGVYKLVYFAFPFEAINGTSKRREVMNDTLNFLNVSGESCSVSFPSITGTYNAMATLEATLKNASGTGISGENIDFFLKRSSKWVKVGNATTDSNGKASISLNLTMKRSVYLTAAVYYGGSPYQRATTFSTLTVNGLPTQLTGITLPSEKLDSGWTVKGTLTEENGTPLGNREVNVAVGTKRTFSEITNENGRFIIEIRVPPGSHQLTLRFPGDATHEPCETTLQVTITDDDTTSPTIQLGTYPSNISYDSRVAFKLNVRDTSGVESVTFRYQIDGGFWKDHPMKHVSGHRWKVIFPKGTFAYGQTVTWQVKAVDMDSDWSGDEEESVTSAHELAITDELPPHIRDASVQPLDPSTTDVLRVASEVFEPQKAAGIERVLMHWSSSEGSTGQLNATLKNGLYQGTITSPPAGTLTITIKAYDNAGNMQTKTMTVNVNQAIGAPTGFLEQHPMVSYSIIGFIALIVIAMGIYIWRKRRSRQDIPEE